MYKCPLCKIEKENSGYCSSCNKEYHKKWYQKNLQQEREKNKRYSKQYRRVHRESCREYQREYQNKHKEGYNLYLSNWRKENAKKIKQYNKKYREENKEKQIIWSYAFHHFRKNMINKIGKCQSCGSKIQLELHHVKYSNDLDDIKLLCRKCHQGEHIK